MRRIGHALATLRWRLTLTFIALLVPLLVLLAGYQYLTLRASLISNRVGEMQADFTSAKRLVATTEKALGATTTSARRLCAAQPALVGTAVATAVSKVTGRTVQVVVYDSNLTREAVAPVGADPPTLDAADLQGVVTRGTRSGAEQVTTSSGDQLVVGFPVVAGVAACGVAQLSVSMTPVNNVLHDEILLITAGGIVILVLALVLGVLLTGRTLRPMRRLTATAEQLAAGDLTARSRLTPSGDEVGQLASSFDHMADRIQEAFTAQQDSEAQVRRFIADASHELRTPLTALKGYIDVLRRGAGREPAALDAALEAMSNESERMRLLVLDLLTLARLDAQREAHPEDFDLNATVDGLLTEGVPGMPAVVERNFVAMPLTVHADRGAVEHHRSQPPGQRLQVRARRRAALEHERRCGLGEARTPRRRARHPRRGSAPRVRALLPGREDAGTRGGRERTWSQHRAGTGARPGRRRGDPQQRGRRHHRDRLAAPRARAAAAPYRLNGDWNESPLNTVNCPVAIRRPKPKRITPATMLITRR